MVKRKGMRELSSKESFREREKEIVASIMREEKRGSEIQERGNG